MRTVRPWLTIARLMDWRIHHVAYVENLYPRLYSNFLGEVCRRPSVDGASVQHDLRSAETWVKTEPDDFELVLREERERPLNAAYAPARPSEAASASADFPTTCLRSTTSGSNRTQSTRWRRLVRPRPPWQPRCGDTRRATLNEGYHDPNFDEQSAWGDRMVAMRQRGARMVLRRNTDLPFRTGNKASKPVDGAGATRSYSTSRRQLARETEAAALCAPVTRARSANSFYALHADVMRVSCTGSCYCRARS
jgi:hypothetical protein